ncbi:MAG TPA: ABC transporter permease subunit [Candidatus Binatia bacterium]|jgi:NitT/TauT family transport system permease protein|nr:ABC transporter permease subunit [Candidatus Binatia bacterium]
MTDGLREDWLWRIGSFAILSAAWEIVGRFSNPLLFPPLSKVISAWCEIILSGELVNALALSISALLLGLFFALVIGISIGIVMGWFRQLENVIDMVFTLVLVIPMVGLIPMLIIAFGLGLKVRIVAIFLFAVPIIAFNSYTGTRQVDGNLVEMARAFGAANWDLLRKIVLPAAIPGIMAGVRLGIGRAVVGMVTAELLIVSVGVGLIIMQYTGTLETAKLYATVVTVIVIGVVVSYFGQWLDRSISERHGRRGAFEV